MIIFITTLLVAGKFIYVQKISEFTVFFGNMNFYERFIQYSGFIQNCFTDIGSKYYGIVYPLRGWQLIQATSINIIGIILLVLAVVGFIVTRKRKESKISIFWIVFSFIILCLIGYGTTENGLTLYTLYFGWAFIILIYHFFEWLFTKIKIYEKTFDIFVYIVAGGLLLYNLYSIYDMISTLALIQ